MDNCNYDNSFNIWLSLYYTGDFINDDEKGHPDLQRFWGRWKDFHKKGIFLSIYGFRNTC